MDSLREFAASVGRTAAGTFDRRGRARRLDIPHWWAAAMIFSVLFTFVEWAMPTWRAGIVARWFVEFLPTLPFFALFVRRMHDQDRAGWWVWMLPPLVVANLYKDVRVHFHAFDPNWPDVGFWSVPLLACAVGYMILMVLPGTVGANRHGADPRAHDTSITI
ncbi:MAG: hypothetical protein JWL96_3050 [Sphingomonas bacterium]|uniref:DUF805 domain-containing protein n=1 Tax=Sphingomonas bacterium TaxID=1895847 RepID=UPI0026387900|nr:DUF805 domain-containing protein [Sphingomonas bacterium]MDB5710980.1 hypothetical protein [Sphingomonas bacterium]